MILSIYLLKCEMSQLAEFRSFLEDSFEKYEKYLPSQAFFSTNEKRITLQMGDPSCVRVAVRYYFLVFYRSFLLLILRYYC